MFFNSIKEIIRLGKVMFLIKEINKLRKEVNRLLSKGMINIYLKITIENNSHSQNFSFLGLKKLSPGQFLESSNLRRYH